MRPIDGRVSDGLTWRRQVRPGDKDLVHRLCLCTGMFSPQEVLVAVELVEACLRQGTASGYHFIFAQREGQALGYACYGPIACTLTSWDLYWIVVDPSHQGRGLGGLLLEQVEKQVATAGGRRLYVETSSRDQYLPTRRFYEQHGYGLAASLEDYYSAGDGMAIYLKILGDRTARGEGLPAPAALGPPATLSGQDSAGKAPRW